VLGDNEEKPNDAIKNITVSLNICIEVIAVFLNKNTNTHGT